MSERPFRVLGVQQIAVGGTDADELRTLWCDLLGVKKVGEYRGEKENVIEDILETGVGAGRVEIDLMRPIDVDAKPKVHSPALNHIGLWVDDLRVAVEWLGKKGVRFTPGGVRPGASGHDICFIHPRSSEEFPFGGAGVLIELVQAPADVIAAHS